MVEPAQQIEAGARIIDQQVGVGAPSAMVDMLRSSAEKKIAAGNAEAAISQIRDPGKAMSQADALSAFSGVFGQDKAVATGKSMTPEQIARKTEGDNQIIAMNRLVEVGFGGLGGGEQTILVNSVLNSLLTHPAMKTYAISEGRNTNAADFKNFCEERAKEFLKNPQVASNILSRMGEALANRDKPDLGALDVLLTRKQSQSKEINVVKTSILAATTDTTTSKNEFDLYKQDLVNPANRGAYETERINAQTEKTNQEGRKTLIDGSVIDVRAGIAAAVFPFYINDPVTGNPARPINNTAEANTYYVECRTAKVACDARIAEQNAIMKQVEEGRKEALNKWEKAKKEEKDLNTQLTSKQNEGLETDAQIKEAGKQLKEFQENRIKDIKKSVTDGVLDEWAKASETVGKIDFTEQEKKAADKANKLLMEKIYDKRKKKFNKETLNSELQALLTNGVEKYGVKELNALKTHCSRPGAPPVGATPEERDMVPVIDQMLADPDKQKEFGQKMSKDMLRLVALKDPKKLEGLFTQDEIAMQSITGNMLGSLIEGAKTDDTLKKDLEAKLGAGLTKENMGERLKKMDKSIIFKLLLISLGLISGIGILGALGSNIGAVAGLAGSAVGTAGSAVGKGLGIH